MGPIITGSVMGILVTASLVALYARLPHWLKLFVQWASIPVDIGCSALAFGILSGSMAGIVCAGEVGLFLSLLLTWAKKEEKHYREMVRREKIRLAA